MAPVAYPLLSANSYFGMAVESIYGTAASVSTWWPVMSPKMAPNVKWLNDASFRGSPINFYDTQAGVFAAQFDMKTYVYADIFPSLLRAALGSTDTVASVAPSTWTHVIGLQNQPNTGSQSPSMTLMLDSVDATYQMVASRLDTLSISLQADAAAECTVSFKGNQPTVVASVSASPFSTQHLMPSWNCAASIAGVSVAVVESLTIDVKRGTQQIYALGSESAVSNFQSVLDVSGKVSIIAQLTDPYWSDGIVRDLQSITLALQDPFTGYSTTFQMSTCQLENPVVNLGKSHVALDVDFFAVGNTTDTAPTSFGYSSLLTTTKNGTSTAY